MLTTPGADDWTLGELSSSARDTATTFVDALPGADDLGDLVGVGREHDRRSRCRRWCASCRTTACWRWARRSDMAGGARRQRHLHCPDDPRRSRTACTSGARLRVGSARRAGGSTITFADRPAERFDEVVFACHGDQVLPLLADPTDRRARGVRRVHAPPPTRRVLHTDASVLPQSPRARASWNYRLGATPARAALGHLRPQSPAGHRRRHDLLRDAQPAARRSTRRKVIGRFAYRHPQFTRRRGRRAGAVARRSAASTGRTTAAPTGATAFTKTA